MVDIKNIVIFCVGSSDIQTKDRKKVIFVDEELRNKFSEENDEIKPLDKDKIETANIEDYSFPIVTPFFDTIIKNYNDISAVYIIGTNQKQADIYKRIQDTYYNAKFIKKYLKEKYKIEEDKIKVEEYVRSPADYNEAYNFFENLFKWIRKNSDGNYKFIINITGGTPAMNTCLLINAFNNINRSDQLGIYYVNKPDPGQPIGECKELNITNFYLNEIFGKICKSFEEKELYGLAADFGEKYLDWEETKIKRLRALDAFIKFNFDEAKELFEEVKNKSRDNKIIEECREYLKQIDDLYGDNKNKKIVAKLKILFKVMKIKKENFEYAEFLSLFIRLYEQLCMLCVHKAYGIELDDDFNIVEESFESKVKELEKDEKFRKEKEEFFKKHGIERKSESLERGLLSYLFLMDFYRRKEDADENTRRFISKVFELGAKDEEERKNNIKKLNEMRIKRNKSILAHGFEHYKPGEQEDEFLKKLGEIINDENLLNIF
jgi:hypothetical protein